MTQRVTVSEAALVLGISKSQVSRQSREWGLVGEDRRFDLQEFRDRRAIELNPLMLRGGTAPDPIPPPLPSTPAVARPTTGSEVAEGKRLQNELLRRKIAEDDRQRVDIGVIVEMIAEAANITRSHWAGFPAHVAGELARENDPDRIEIILQARINEMLAGFSKALQRAGQPIKQDSTEAA